MFFDNFQQIKVSILNKIMEDHKEFKFEIKIIMYWIGQSHIAMAEFSYRIHFRREI